MQRTALILVGFIVLSQLSLSLTLIVTSHTEGTCESTGSKEESCLNQAGSELHSMILADPGSETALLRVDGSDLGVPQVTSTQDISQHDLRDHLDMARRYMSSEQLKDQNINPEVLKECRNKHELCTQWSLLGECDANPKYMKKNCGPVCRSCHYLTVDGRCKIEDASPNVWGPGDLDKTFRRLSSEPLLSKYQVKVLSSPDNETKGPWVITMESVVSTEEAEELIAVGGREGYKRSTGVGPIQPDGTIKNIESDSRTSSQAWCDTKDCLEKEVIQNVTIRISDMIQLPPENAEHFQFLRYEVGQFYRSHHDYISQDQERQQGPRVLTAYVYLNDVEEGGGTEFTSLNLTITPKCGRAVIWPSVLDNQPEEEDFRTNHAALPVMKGEKFGANLWFHLRNFKIPHENDCT